MNHPNYDFQFVTAGSEVEYPGFTKRWIYRFKGKTWPYLVYIEQYQNSNLYAVKFFPKDHSESAYKYNLLTKQNEPRTIFNTIIRVLDDFVINRDSKAVFCYLSAPTPICEGYNNNRKFRFYQRAGYDSLNPETWHVDYNAEHSAVILFRRQNVEQGQNLQSDISSMIMQVFADVDWGRKMCPGCTSDCENWQKNNAQTATA